MKRTSFFILAAAMIISLCACSEKISCSGDISFSLPRTISSRSEAAGVNQEITVSNYNVTLSQENETIESENFKPETQIKFTDLTPGEYRIALKASMSDGSIFSGSKSVTVEAGKTAKCEIKLEAEKTISDIWKESELMDIPEEYFTISKEGYSVIPNPDAIDLWYFDGTDLFTLTTITPNLNYLFNVFYNGELIENEYNIDIIDFAWSDIGTGKIKITTKDNNFSTEYEIMHKYEIPEPNFSNASPEKINTFNNIAFTISAQGNPSSSIYLNGKKIEKTITDVTQLAYYWTLNGTEIPANTESLTQLIPATQNKRIELSLEDLDINTNGSYSLTVHVRQIPYDEYRSLFYTPNTRTETIRFEVDCF